MHEESAVFDLRSDDRVTVLQLFAEAAPMLPYRVVLATPAMRAAVTVSITRSRFATYFSSLAADWRGWNGTRKFIAHAPDVDYGLPALTIAATADGAGHTTLTVRMGVPSQDLRSADWRDIRAGGSGLWAASAMILIEAGQLDDLAERASRLPHDSVGHW